MGISASSMSLFRQSFVVALINSFCFLVDCIDSTLSNWFPIVQWELSSPVVSLNESKPQVSDSGWGERPCRTTELVGNKSNSDNASHSNILSPIWIHSRQ
jgi:hypothetical protein